MDDDGCLEVPDVTGDRSCFINRHLKVTQVVNLHQSHFLEFDQFFKGLENFQSDNLKPGCNVTVAISS